MYIYNFIKASEPQFSKFSHHEDYVKIVLAYRLRTEEQRP